MSDRHRLTVAVAVAVAYAGALCFALGRAVTFERALGYCLENAVAALLSVLVQLRSQRHERLIAIAIALVGGLIGSLGFSAIGFAWTAVHVLALVSGWQWLMRPSTLDVLLSPRSTPWNGGMQYIVLASWCVTVVMVMQPGMRVLPVSPIVGLLWIIGIPANVACALAPRQPVVAGAIANICPLLSVALWQGFDFLRDGPPEGILLLLVWVGVSIGGSLVYSVPIVMYERHRRERATYARPALSS